MFYKIIILTLTRTYTFTWIWPPSLEYRYPSGLDTYLCSAIRVINNYCYPPHSTAHLLIPQFYRLPQFPKKQFERNVERKHKNDCIDIDNLFQYTGHSAWTNVLTFKQRLCRYHWPHLYILYLDIDWTNHCVENSWDKVQL